MRLACSALLLAAACGNLSNEDVAFLVAIPQRDQLHVAVPANGGTGRMTLHFETAAALGINKPTDPTGPMRIYYDRFEDPHTISLDLTSSTGFGLVSFDYGYAGYADGHGRFDYAFPDPKSGCKVE